jgi:EAL domain-containing protein (putative c-di-GMP-specific phosphodiesterase class I)
MSNFVINGGPSLDEAAFHSILEEECVNTHFQPILSLKNPSFIAVEGLARAKTAAGQIIPPDTLFSVARMLNRTLETDRLCRAKALESFRGIQAAMQPAQDPLLFLNFDTSLLDQGVAGSGVLLAQSARYLIDPSRIVIEIVESAVHDAEALKRFITFYRQQGFIIALDDVGAGHSNFDRFPLIKPDIIKVDRSIISGIQNDYYKQEIFKALVKLSRKIGTLVLAEGVETEDEVLCVLNCDTDLLQGYFFAKPAATWDVLHAEMGNKVRIMADKLRESRIGHINRLRDQYRLYDETIDKIAATLAMAQPDEFAGLLDSCIADLPFIEAVYVLDRQGVMVTDTLLQPFSKKRLEKLFRKAVKGDNLSLKEYFYLLMFSGLKHFVTESYTSLATGNLTRTISSLFTNKGGESFVLCVDVQGDLTPAATEKMYELTGDSRG